jgi:hypothetical protein
MMNHRFFRSTRSTFGTLALATVIGPIGCSNMSGGPDQGQAPLVSEETDGLISRSEPASEASAKLKPKGKPAILELFEGSGGTGGSGNTSGVAGSTGAYGAGGADGAGGAGGWSSTTVTTGSFSSGGTGGSGNTSGVAGSTGAYGAGGAGGAGGWGSTGTVTSTTGSFSSGGAGGWSSTTVTTGSDGSGGAGGAGGWSSSGVTSSSSGDPEPSRVFFRIGKDAPVCGAQNGTDACDDWSVSIGLPPELLHPGKISLASPEVFSIFSSSGEDDGSQFCSFGGGSFIKGSIEILRVEPKFVVFRLAGTDKFEFNADGKYVADRCDTP